MILNVIIDSRRLERYEPLISELSRQEIEYELWPCLMYNNVVTSINNSHKMIVRKAKEDGLVETAIAEDDLYFPNEKGWEWFLKNKPDVFDIYVGGSYLHFKRPEVPCAVKVDCIVGLHLYIINEKYYDTFLATSDLDHIDTAQRGDIYVCYPMPALQRPGFSSNNQAQCNYNSILNKEDIYQ